MNFLKDVGPKNYTPDEKAPCCERHRHHLGRHTVTPRTTFDPDRCHSVTGAYRFPLWPQPFRSEVANNSNRLFCCGAYTVLRATSPPPRTSHRDTENDFRPRPMS